MKKLLLIFLALGMLFANTPQQALDSYYTSFMLEYTVDSYLISGLECIEDGEDALCEYKLHAEISGAETFSYDLDYLALLHKVSGEWKVSFAMPLDEYLEIREEQEKFATLEEMLDEEDELYSKEPLDGPGQVTFNGVPMSDMSSELDDMLYSCTSNEYCQQYGYGDFCGADGRCSGSADDGWDNVDLDEDDGWEDVVWDEDVETDQESCPLSFGLLLIPFILFLKKN
ncbi:MAG: hypothetical protein GY852_08905 [bacterium]|nr:hypothetical protein [bacterium]